MAVKKKDKKLLQDMWDGADDFPESAVPDGKYQFKIAACEFEMSSSDKPRIVSEIEVVGGNEEFIGETVKIYDNLETGENMSWFKRKLNKLGIELPEDFDEIIDGSVVKELAGKIFDGQAKSKDGFFNIYVNKLVGEDEEASDDEAEEETEEASEEMEKGDLITFTFKGKEKEGEILEILEDEDRIRVKEDETDKKFKVASDKVELRYEDGEEEGSSDEEEEEEAAEESNFATVKEAKKLKKDEAIEALQALGIETDDLKKPKDICVTIATVLEGEDKPKKPEVLIALKAFGLKPKSADKLIKLIKKLSSEIDAALME